MREIKTERGRTIRVQPNHDEIQMSITAGVGGKLDVSLNLEEALELGQGLFSEAIRGFLDFDYSQEQISRIVTQTRENIERWKRSAQEEGEEE